MDPTLLKVTATQIVLDLYKRQPKRELNIEEFLRDVEAVLELLNATPKEKGATISSLHPVQ